MTTKFLKPLRIAVVTILILLAIQFEFGMAINLSDLHTIPAFTFSFPDIVSALNQVGFVAIFHAGLGTTLTLFSLVNLILSLASKLRKVQIFGALSFLSMVLAAFSGVLFTLSGFQNDHYSHGMATNFILTFGFHFLEFYFLKTGPSARTIQTREERI